MSFLTEALIKEKLITWEQLNDAKAKSLGAKKPLQEILVELSFISEEALLSVCSRIFNMPVMDLDQEKINVEVVRILPFSLAKRYGVFPVSKEGDTLTLAMSDPQDIMAVDDIKLATGLAVKPLLCSRSQINRFVDKYYNTDDSIYDILKNVNAEEEIEIIRENKEIGALDDDLALLGEGAAPVIKLANIILSDAVKAKASDIHIEPQEKAVKVRYRIDGDLRSIMDVPLKYKHQLASRVKILADLDIAETRKPQDGRSKIIIGKRQIDLRISTIPTFYGEKIELRLLDQKEAKTDFAKIGFREDELKIVKEASLKSQGIVLVTGPTGSGKTSTLYAILNFVKSEAKNIVTIEDPIEYLIGGISQIQVNPAKDLTFASGLRSILRQDPNVILVGEVRDKDTADIAFRASLTGHLVFSTLHTNSAVASIIRLLDIGLEPYLISSSIILIIAQRLVKVICPDCKEEYIPDQVILNRLKGYIDELGIKRFYHGKGCQSCDFTGYKGRTAVFELFSFNDDIRRLIIDKASEEAILAQAKKDGLKTISYSAMSKVAEGVTTLDEVLRISGMTEDAQSLKASLVKEKPKILLVDDEEDILMILDKRLKAVGYDVILARDGGEALAIANRDKPDLIITDGTMPKMNGFELIKALRLRLETAVTPIIMLTARQDKDSEIKGLDVGADDYITKPFDLDKLLARVKMLLRRKA